MTTPKDLRAPVAAGAELFVYGTLRHDQPEHARYCRGVLGWKPARLRASLWRIPAGYRLAVVPPGAVLFDATTDAIADERRRSAIDAPQLARAASAATDETTGWIEGELLAFSDAALAWPPLDAWENSAPGEPGMYPRRVVPVEVCARDARWRVIAAWAYVGTRPAAGAVALA